MSQFNDPIAEVVPISSRQKERPESIKLRAKYPGVYKTGPDRYRLKYEQSTEPGKRKQAYEAFRGSHKEAVERRAWLVREFGKKTAAEQEKHDLKKAEEAAKIAQAAAVAAAKGRTIKECAEDFKRSELIDDNYRRKTIERLRQNIDNQIIPKLGHFHLSELTPRVVSEFYTWLREWGRVSRSGRADRRQKEFGTKGGISKATVQKIHQGLRAILSFEIEQSKSDELRKTLSWFFSFKMKKFDEAPRRITQGKSLSGGIEKTHALDPDQLRQLLARLKEFENSPNSYMARIHSVVYTAAFTGLRRGELLGLIWDDVNFNSRTLRIERSIEEAKGVLGIGPTKNSGSQRTIGLSAGVCKVLENLKADQMRQLEEVSRHGGVAPKIEQVLVFCESVLVPNRPIRPSYLTRKVAHIARSIGLTGFVFHGLRHTHVTMLLADGVPIHTIAKRVGHSDPSMILKVYGHPTVKGDDAAMRATEALERSLLD